MSEPTVGRARGYSGRSVGKTASNISRTTSNTPKSPLPPVLSPTDWMDKATEALMVDPSDKKQPQRRRGTSFRDEYRALKNGGRTRVRAPSMIHEPTKDHMIPPQRKELRNKYTIVLDLDETLIYARDGPLFARPHLDLLFALLKEHCETVVWTAGVKAYAQTIIRNIDPSNTIEHCIYRHKKWFSGKAGYQKDLTLLGRNMDHVLIIENTPDCVRGNPSNGVLVADYVCSGDGSQVDPTIPTLTHFIARLIESGKTVPEFLATTDMLSETEMMTDVGDSYDVYTLNSKQLAVTGLNRINRDLLSINTNDSTPAADTENLVSVSPIKSGNLVSKISSSDDLRTGYTQGLMKGAVALNVPLSPGGTFHNEWINCVAL